MPGRLRSGYQSNTSVTTVVPGALQAGSLFISVIDGEICRSTAMKNILFVCVENSCRSQMAEGFAKMLGNGELNAHSSGSKPSGVVNPKAIASMSLVGYDLSKHESKSLDEIPQIDYDYLVTMGCGDACPSVCAKIRLDWQIPDPKHMEEKDFAEVRDLIRDQVTTLIDSFED